MCHLVSDTWHDKVLTNYVAQIRIHVTNTIRYGDGKMANPKNTRYGDDKDMSNKKIFFKKETIRRVPKVYYKCLGMSQKCLIL